MTIHRSRVLWALALAAPFAAASAQQQSSQPAESGLETITVTAQRVETDIQTTPIAVSALTGDFLTQYSYDRVTALEGAVPNLNFSASTGGASSQVSAFIRGVGEFDFLLTTDPAVGLYIDGVYLARTFGSNLDLAEPERVEVLRGPQGTLFGKNNIGGAINVVTRQPEGDGRIRAELEYGSYNSWRALVSADIGLTDNLALLLTAGGKQSDGWQDRPGADGGEEDRAGARAALRWTPSDTFESTLALDYVKQDQINYPNVMVDFDGSLSPFVFFYNAFVLPTLPPGTAPCCTANTDIDKSGVPEGFLPHDDLETWGATWFNTWQFGDGLSLKSITAYRDMQALFGRDGDNSALDYSGDVHDEDQDQFSQELQLSSQGNDTFNWIVGAYYLREKTRDQTRLVTADGLFDALTALAPFIDFNNPNDPLLGLYAARYAVDLTVDFDNHQTTTDYAAYAHGDWTFNDRWHFGLGLRYTNEEKEFTQTATRVASQTPLLIAYNPFTDQPILTGPGGENLLDTPSPACSDLDLNGAFKCKSDWDNVSGDATLGFDFTDDVYGYARYSRGFRSGGINGRPIAVSQVQDYDPEYLDSIELGLKSMLADHRLRLNAAAFYNKYQDIQVLLTRNAQVEIQNAAKATIYGLELDMEARPVDAWLIHGSLGLMHNEFDEWSDEVNGEIIDHTDRKMRNAPETTFNLLTAYDIGLASSKLTPWVEVQYRDSVFLDGENTPQLESPSLTILNAGVRWTLPNEAWQVEARGSNITDERELTGGFNGLSFFGYVEGYYNPPARYYVGVKYNSK
jgi:iron complex outermembrane receptor protein